MPTGWTARATAGQLGRRGGMAMRRMAWDVEVHEARIRMRASALARAWGGDCTSITGRGPWGRRAIGLALASSLALASWTSGLRAEEGSPAPALGAPALDGSARPAPDGASPSVAQRGAAQHNSGRDNAGSAGEGSGAVAGGAKDGGAAATSAPPDALSIPPSGDVGAKVGAKGGEGTDEDAATALPEPEDGKPRRGAEGPAPAPRGPSAYAGLPTALPTPAEPGHIDDVTLPRRDVAVISGRSSWDDGFTSLFDSFDVLAKELASIGVKPTGRPFAVFVSTDEAGFSYEAMAPIAAPPAEAGKVGGGVRFEKAEGGKAIRFTHKAPYEEIDTTYEAITAYLDSKGIVAEDAFTEEYVTDPRDPSDASLQINIYVQPKKDAKSGAGPSGAEGAPVPGAPKPEATNPGQGAPGGAGR